jgi:predicted nucleic acid-binding protein
MSNWVRLDASWVVQFVRARPGNRPAGPVANVAPTGICSGRPHLALLEVSNALHRYVRHGDLSPGDAAQALDIALAMRLSLYGDADPHRRAMAVARQFDLPAAYDAHCLALAEWLGAELWTADPLLHQAVGSTLGWVHCVAQP